ncbi:DUF2187 family protein [Lysinibacillus sp. BF-4]|uniref:DUF2187 domain-containing protein n=1 Tax=Metalysinibacillus saudimassiliensis TaxID=1461583 RepID=A0A078M7P2_9BACL|nr:hypothetical protein BN1050_01215 [Metalysinibacillus saudimassiliensis]
MTEKKEEEDIIVAEIGNIIEFRDGLQGIVEKINENSVIVNLTYMENFEQLGMEERTVINHKRYKIIADSQ